MEAERNAEKHYFPPGRSMARRVHGERAVGLLYGQRALLIGALEPLTYTGTMMSTWSGNRPFERLARTAKIQETVFLGTGEEADEVLAKVRRLHETVKGELNEAAGRFPAGTPYSAFDPELMLWTLAVIADSGREMYETLVRPLDPEERERLWQDYVRFGELFGLPASEVPASHVEFKDWFDGMLAAPDLQATAHGLEMAPLVAFRQPVPAPARANIAFQNHLIKGTLPPRGSRDLRHPLEPRPRVELPRDRRRKSARSRRLPVPDAARSQRRLLRRRHRVGAQARRHSDATARCRRPLTRRAGSRSP